MSKKKKSKTTTQVIRDPIEQQIAEMRLAQEKLFQPQREKAVAGLESMLWGTPFGDTGQPLGVLPGLHESFRRGFAQDIAPDIASRLVASGMGRSGAIGEQIRKAGTSAELPLQQLGLQTLLGLSDPNRILMEPARTTISKSTQSGGGFNPFDILLPAASGIGGAMTAPFYGGSSLLSLAANPFGYSYFPGSGFVPYVGGKGMTY